MRKRVYVLWSCALVLIGALASTASAGEYYRHGYYGGGYYGGGNRDVSVWYSSSCCYKKVTRHVSRYVRVHPYEHHQGYYENYRHYGLYDRPYRYGSYTRGYYDGSAHVSYRSYDSYDAYTDHCSRRRVPVADGRGGWVWGVKLSCN